MALLDLVPHRPPMLLLDQLIEHDEHHTTCETTIGEHTLFSRPDGGAPVWVGLEYMAQCISVHAGLRARATGGRPRLGFLIGSRHVDFHVDGFARGQVLHVVAEEVWGGAEFGSFACRLYDPSTNAILAEGTLKVFAPADMEGFMAGAPR
jgi:predicted hotdog family 3-hydroxylacyl-ACP dehydratase